MRASALRKQLSLMRDVVLLLRSPGDASLAGVAALVIASGLCPVAFVYVTRGIVDRLVAARNAGGEWDSVLSLLLWASLGAALMLISQVLASALAWVRTLHEERLRDHITQRIHEQSVRLDLAFYESPTFFDRLHRAREEASYRPAELCHAFVDVLQGSVTLIGLGAILVAFGPWLPAVLFFGALPVLYVVSSHALEYQRWRRRTTRDERRAWYYDLVLTSSDHAPELRLFGSGGSFQHGHRVLRERLRGEHLALLWRRSLAEAGAAAGSLVVMGGAVVWIGWRAVQRLVTLGQLAAFYHAFAAGLATMRSLLAGVARVHANGLFIESLFEFLAMEPNVVSPPVPVAVPARIAHGIRFRNVTFHYPGAARPALSGFNLHVSAGQRIAIVGPNGAGKSTLIKLICRLYDPIAGSVEIDGVDIRQFDLQELRRMVTALFQQPVHYFQSAEDNIRIGSPPGVLTPGDIRRASAAAGASTLIEGLPHGYSTILGKWFDDGTELSAGEWQRVALARMLARPSQIVVLDEPTSALDPWAEAEWYRRFCGAAGDRTSIIITHRLSTAMQADAIHVIEDGRIVESGTHDTLIARRGRYARSWRASNLEDAMRSPVEMAAS